MKQEVFREKTDNIMFADVEYFAIFKVRANSNTEKSLITF